MAARNFGVNINLNQNQILGLILENLVTAPESPKEGRVYYNTTDHEAYKWNGTEWLILGNMSNQAIRDLLSGIDGVTYDSATGTFSADVDGVTIQVGVDGLEIKDGGISTAKLADDSVDKTKIAADVAGEGLEQDADGSIKVSKTSYKETIGDGTTKVFSINHGLASLDVVIDVLDVNDNYSPIEVASINDTLNSSQITFNDAPANGQYRVIAHKF